MLGSVRIHNRLSQQFKDYVRSLNQSYIDEQLGQNALVQGDFYPFQNWRPGNPAVIAARLFRDGNADARITQLDTLAGKMPLVPYHWHVPSVENNSFNRNIDIIGFGFDQVCIQSVQFSNLIGNLQFWANHFRSSREDVGPNDNVKPRSGFIYEVVNTPRFILELLAKMLLPPELFELVSKTESGLAFALLTGRVVESKYDPTVDRQKWANISTLNIFDKATLVGFHHLLEDHVPDLPDPNIFGNFYYVSDPRIMALFPYVQLESYFKRRPDANYKLSTLAAELHRKYITIPDFEVALGFNPVYYEHSESLRTAVKDVAGYILHKELGLPRSELLYSVPTTERQHEITEVLLWYTDDEIMSFYLPNIESRQRRGVITHKFTHRNHISTNISLSYVESNFTWTVQRDKYQVDCINGGNVNVAYGGSRNEDLSESTLEEIMEDPILTYGSFLYGGKERCFRTSELLQIFTETLNDPQGADFPDPDYLIPGRGRPHVIDPLTGRRLPPTFNFNQMITLRSKLNRFIETQIGVPGFDRSLIYQLYTISQQILPIRFPAEMNSVVGETLINILEIREIVTANPAWRNDLLILFGWLFMFSMWMRFWKGPGYPFNIDKVTTSTNKCVPIQRDEHITIELNMYNDMLRQLEKENVELAAFVKRLSVFNRDWSDRHSISIRTPLTQVLNKIQNGLYCMGFAGDELIATAYVYLVEVMDVPEDRVRDLVTYVLELLRGREQLMIDERKMVLKNTLIEDKSDQLWFDQGMESIQVHELLLRIGEPGYELPPISFATVAYNMHVN